MLKYIPDVKMQVLLKSRWVNQVDVRYPRPT